MSNAVHYLDKNTARLITSNQVIQGPYNIVKELVENALDANATSLEIRLDNFGFDKVEVKDNGRGIKKSDVPLMFLPGHSSKIKEFSDIDNILTYGFRGEALGAICCIANCTMVTKTEEDTVANFYKFDCDGNIVETKPSHLGQGTTVTVSQLFCHQPARRRMLLSGRAGASLGASKSSTLSSIRSYLGAMGVAWPQIRISFIHNGSLVWRKQPVALSNSNMLITAFGETLGHAHATLFQQLAAQLENSVALNVLVPKIDSGIKEICQSSKAAMIIILNKRVIRHKKIENMMIQHLNANFTEIGKNKYPACVVEVTIDSHDVDINLEPDKSKILIKSDTEEVVLEEIGKLLSSYYSNVPLPTKKSVLSKAIEEPTTDNTESNELDEVEPKAKKIKLDSDEIRTETGICREISTVPSSKPSYTIEILGADETENPNSEELDSIVETAPSVPSTVTLTSPQTEEIPPEHPSPRHPDLDSQSDCHVSPHFTVRKEASDDNSPKTVGSHNQCSTLQPSSLTSSVTDISSIHVSPHFTARKETSDNGPKTVEHTSQHPPLIGSQSDFEESPHFTARKETSDSPKTVGSQSSTCTLQPSSLTSSVTDISSIPEDLSDLDTSIELSGEEQDALLELEKLYENDSDNKQKDELKLCPTMDESLQKAWSRGQLTTGNGNNLESCSVLTPTITPLSNMSFNSGASPSSQMGCRELAGFSLFCKETRPQILKSEPGIVFTAVAQRLARQWKELPLVDKERYGELAKQFKLARKLHPIQKCPRSIDFFHAIHDFNSKFSPQVQAAKTKKNFQTKIVQQPAANKGQQKIVPSVPATKSPKLDVQTNVKPKSKPGKQKKEVEYPFNLQHIEELSKESCEEEEHVTVVGQVEKFWLLKEGSAMVMMCPWVMQEVLVLEDLKAEFVLPVAELDSPLPISSSEIGWQCWQTLSALESQWDVMSNSTKITSPLITSNGFHIRVTREEGDCNISTAEITKISNAIPGFGLHNLKEILCNISKTPDCTLARSRPEIVLKFMEEKASESGQAMFEKSTDEFEVKCMLKRWQLKNLETTRCHHGKEFCMKLITIENETD